MLDQAATSVILVVQYAQPTEFALLVPAQPKNQVLSVNAYLAQFYFAIAALQTMLV